MRHFRLLGGFALVPMLSMIATLALLPLVSGTFGPAGWSAVMLGQSLGAFVSVLAGLAWQVTGAQLVASSEPPKRRLIYAESLRSRALMLMLCLPPAVIIALVLISTYRLETVAFLLATSLNCFNASWYFAGTGQPKFVLINEGLIRLGVYIASIPLVIYSGQLWVYAAALVLGGLSMALANAVSIFRGHSLPQLAQMQSSWSVVRSHVSGMSARSLQAGQQYLGVPLVAGFAPTLLPLFSALDALQKAAVNATAFYHQAFASWVGSASSTVDSGARVRRLGHLTLVVGLLGLLAWVAFGTYITEALFAGKVQVTPALNLWNGITIASFSALRAFGLLGLIPLGETRAYYVAIASAAVASAISFAACLLLYDLTTGMASVAVVYLLASGIMYVKITRVTSRPR
jgi:hypothetical protein